MVYCENPYSDEVCNYESEYKLKNDHLVGYPYLYFLNKNEIVHKINLFKGSDDFIGVEFYTDKSFIKRSRDNAKFYVKKANSI